MSPLRMVQFLKAEALTESRSHGEDHGAMVTLTKHYFFSPLSVPLRLCEIPQKFVIAVKRPSPPDKPVGDAVE